MKLKRMFWGYDCVGLLKEKETSDNLPWGKSKRSLHDNITLISFMHTGFKTSCLYSGSYVHVYSICKPTRKHDTFFSYIFFMCIYEFNILPLGKLEVMY